MVIVMVEVTFGERLLVYWAVVRVWFLLDSCSVMERDGMRDAVRWAGYFCGWAAGVWLAGI